MGFVCGCSAVCVSREIRLYVFLSTWEETVCKQTVACVWVYVGKDWVS